MPRKIRNISLAAVATSALVLAPFLGLAANAAPADEHVLVFSNGDYTDTNPGQEYDQTLAAVQGTGATVTPFDGGDGSAAAWTAALTGVDLLVIPELESDNFGSHDLYDPAGTSALSTDAAAVLKDWISSGHQVIFTGAYDAEKSFSYLTGVDYSSVWSNDNSSDGWVLQITNPSLPTTIPAANYSGGSDQFDSWTDEQKEPLTAIYVSADGTNLGIGRFAVGTGSITYVAYDFFPGEGGDDDEDTATTNTTWVTALQTLILEAAPAEPAPAPAAVVPDPTLAATGTDATVPLIVASVLTLLGAGIFITRRRIASRA